MGSSNGQNPNRTGQSAGQCFWRPCKAWWSCSLGCILTAPSASPPHHLSCPTQRSCIHPIYQTSSPQPTGHLPTLELQHRFISPRCHHSQEYLPYLTPPRTKSAQEPPASSPPSTHYTTRLSRARARDRMVSTYTFRAAQLQTYGRSSPPDGRGQEGQTAEGGHRQDQQRDGRPTRRVRTVLLHLPSVAYARPAAHLGSAAITRRRSRTSTASPSSSRLAPRPSGHTTSASIPSRWNEARCSRRAPSKSGTPYRPCRPRTTRSASVSRRNGGAAASVSENACSRASKSAAAVRARRKRARAPSSVRPPHPTSRSRHRVFRARAPNLTER